MSFFETPLGEALEAALDSGKDEEIAARVNDVLSGIWPKQLDAEQIQDVVVKLQRRAQFGHVVAIADAALATDMATIETRRRYSQALIEIGALHAAELELNRILGDAEASAKEQGEARGLLGRLRKQRYIFGNRSSDLRDAIQVYNEAYDGGTDPMWHGVNLLALMKRAQRYNQPVPPGLPNLEQLAGTVLALVQQVPELQRDIWTRATEVEALVAQGDLGAAQQVAQGLAASKNVDNFELNSLRRQLLEVWELEPSEPVVLAIADRTLQLGQAAIVDLPDNAMQLEKILGTALPIGYETLMKGMRAAESVCKITDAAGEGWGTGFLISGSLIDATLGDGPMLATNAHVVSSLPGISQLQAAEAEARFDVTNDVDGNPLIITGLRELWTSPPNRCDITLLAFDTPLPEIPQPIQSAPVLPPVSESAYVYVIGHPAGAGVKFSIRGNDLLAYDDEERRVHYTAPTEPGSSGSPVFNAAWQLMAIHHAGNAHMKRLDNPSETYKANEGITIDSIRREYAANPPG